MSLRLPFRLLLLLGLGLSPLGAQEAPRESFIEALRGAGVELIAGPTTVPLGRVAEIKLPAGYHAIAAGSIKRYYELTQNALGGKEQGVVLAPSGWTLFFDYDDIGYVKDDDKDDLNAGKLLKSMQDGQKEANKYRRDQGWDEMLVAGWATPPHYDTATNNLKWALNLSSSQDGHATTWINESIRLLGRRGVMNVTLVTDNDSFTRDSRAADQLLAGGFGYVAGQRYAEFREGDKIAQYGLAALVLGGAGAAAFKLGFLQKFWKLLVIGAVAVVAGLRKFFGRVTGGGSA